MIKVLMIVLIFGLTPELFCQKSTEQKLDELMNAYCKVNKFNGSVLISRKGKILLEKGYGLKEAATNRNNDANSIFQIYSITKTFTSTVILKLAEAKLLSLTEKLSTFYPDFPKGDSITIEHLLTHTSGIYEYTRGNDMKDQKEKSFVSFLKAKPLDFLPGSGWSYSNSGYWLLGFIIEKVTLMSYEDAVRKYIFNPVLMTESGFDFKTLKHQNKTTGYNVFSEQYKKEAVIYDPPGPYAAGAIYSTVRDLYKYHNALQSFKLLDRELLEKAYTPFKNNYGYGWMINSFEGNETVSHSGGADGYRSNFTRMIKEDICIVLLNNTENSNVELITKNIFSILFDKPYNIPSEIKIPSLLLAQFVGCFKVDPSFTMYITIENGRLAAQATGQGRTVVLAHKKNYFYAEEADGFLEFLKDSTGKYNELVIHQRGQKFNAMRFYPVWGLIGDATTKGWDEKTPDIPFSEDKNLKGIWVLGNIKLNAGELKFRFNNDWNINYGDNKNDKSLDLHGDNIKVEPGIYDLIIDLTDETTPKYKMVRRGK